MTTGQKLTLSLAGMALVGLAAPLGYRHYLLHAAASRPAPVPVSAPATDLAAAAGARAPVAASVATDPPPAPDAWAAAIAQVQEVRGSAGRVEVPPELNHYEDRRRFLAVQMADSQARQYRLPDDEADLADMIRRREIVEMEPLADDYLLYDLGTDAREDPFVHYDAASGQDVPLFPTVEAYQAEDERLARAAAAAGKAGAKARERRELLASYYGDPQRREDLVREHQAITALASDFGGVAYRLDDPADRRRFQIRLLSFIRPEGRDILLEIARAYHERFGRRLPVTSMIRTQRYQKRLGRVNRNATPVDLPPHTTGMAFDISYKFMASDEQNFIMEEVARLKDSQKVEALRERRNHFHVYVLADGPPPEPLIASFFDEVEAAHPNSAPRPAAAPAVPSRRPAARALRGSRGR